MFFRYLQRCISTNTDINLLLVKKKDVEVLPDDSPYDFQIEEVWSATSAELTNQEFLSTDPVIHYDHKELKIATGTSLAPIVTTSPKTHEVVSVWDIQIAFRLKAVSVSNVPFSGKNMAVFVSIRLFCGDEPISKQFDSPSASVNPENKTAG